MKMSQKILAGQVDILLGNTVMEPVGCEYADVRTGYNKKELVT